MGVTGAGGGGSSGGPGGSEGGRRRVIESGDTSVDHITNMILFTLSILFFFVSVVGKRNT